MKLQNREKHICENSFFYLAGAAIVLGLLLFHRRADSGALIFLLAPVARWVEMVSGVRFVYEPGAGYVNHSLRFVIAPSCSGLRFFTITFAMLYFSFARRQKRKGSFLMTCLAVSYGLTIFVNGLRIVLAIYLPLFLSRTAFYSPFLTQERLHTLIGIVVYFTSLCLIYRGACRLLSQTALTDQMAPGESPGPVPLSRRFPKPPGCRNLTPLLWYVSLVLGIPFLNRAYENGGGRFAEYAALVIPACLGITGLLWGAGAVGRGVKNLGNTKK